MIRPLTMLTLFLGCAALAAWHFSGAVGHFLGLKVGTGTYPHVRVHPIFQVFGIGGIVLLVSGTTFLIIDFWHGLRGPKNG